jgi:hypothetical protein
MKNIQVIDGAKNSTFDVYSVPNSLFCTLFPNGTDIAFVEELADTIPGMDKLYLRPLRKTEVRGIHGTLHLKLSDAEPKYFPSRHESDVRMGRKKQKGKSVPHLTKPKGHPRILAVQ